MGRTDYVDPLPPLEVGDRVWAWKAGIFEPARVAGARKKPPADGSRAPRCPVVMDAGDPDPIVLPTPLLRVADTQPKAMPGHEWHSRRRREMLRRYPEIGRTAPLPGGVYPLMMAAALALHLAVGAGIATHSGSRLLWVWCVVLAGTLGAACVYACQQLMHEACHARYGKLMQRLALAAEVTLGTTGPDFFVYYLLQHIPHHQCTGEVKDPDIVFHGHWAVLPRWAGRSRLGRFAWLTLFALFTLEIMVAEHLIGRVRQPRFSRRNRRLIAMFLLKYAFMAFALGFGGVWCLVYFRLAAGFALGAFGHPYAGFWLMQHMSVERNGYQPTVSYSGSWLWHWLTLRQLYHVEHHDFPWLPFTRIAGVRKIAPEFYSELYVVPSIWRLTWQWISHTDGTPWMEVAGAVDCIAAADDRIDIHRPAPEIRPVAG